MDSSRDGGNECDNMCIDFLGDIMFRTWKKIKRLWVKL